jgi:serine/threonine-protein kinase
VDLPERYEDRGALARGGWGEVRRAFDRVLDRVVAMKILAREHVGAQTLLPRFLNEARVTASLEHPGIVPVHDRGTLPDGRPWFTMKEVRGRTLHDITHHDPGARLPLRRLVEILVRVAETVGYAHERGVLHRDLKPSNVMVGEFGEVLVLDWGIARTVHENEPVDVRSLSARDAELTGTGEILGTVGYMSPEQGRGIGEPLSPASDVFSLALVLYELLTGERARPHDRVQAWAMAAMGTPPKITPSRDIPEELATLVVRGTALAPEGRPRNGMAFAELLHAWLDGSMRRERAAALVAQARAGVVGLEELRASRDKRRAEARRIQSEIREHDPVERKRPLWTLEDEARSLDQQIDRIEAEYAESLRAALELDAEHEEALSALAEVYRRQVLDAEARGAPADVMRAERSLRRYDRGRHERFLRGLGRVVIDSVPSGVLVRASRYVPRERRMVPTTARELGRTPLDLELEAGSWLFELVRPTGITRLPARVVRDERWTVAPDGDRPVRCVDASEDEVHVPAGWAMVGGDEQAIEPVPARSVWIDDFVMQRVQVTVAEYLRFLESLSPDEAGRCVPRSQHPTGHDPTAPPLVEHVGGRWQIRGRGEGGQPIDPRWPVTSIDWNAASRYAAWMAETTGLPWRLPDELEWEKAARGVDGRSFPWGDFGEPTWSRVVGSTEDVPCRAPVGSYPIDESPYGVRDMAGNARTWCAGAWALEGPAVEGKLVAVPAALDDRSLRVIRGSSWSSVGALTRCASRFAGKPSESFSAVGIRLVRSLAEPT